MTTRYLVDDLNPTGYAQVVEETGGVNRTYTYGLQRISENQIVNNAWTPSFYEYDGMGSVRQLTNSAGAVTDTYEYDAFGNLLNKTGTTPNEMLYRGEQWDSDLGLYYLRARWYDPQSERFMSRDPNNPQPMGPNGEPINPDMLHKYLYAGGDPVDLLDPTGRATVTKPTGILGDAAGEYAALVQNISFQLFKFQYVTVPVFINSEQGKRWVYVLLSSTALAASQTCIFAEIANELGQLEEDLSSNGAIARGPGLNCNEQPHPANGGAGESKTPTGLPPQ